MFSRFTEEARKILVGAKKEMKELCHPYIGSEHLILSILKDKSSEITKKLKNYNFTYETFRSEVIRVLGTGSQTTEWFLYTPLVKRVIENAILDSRENNKGEVTENHLFLSLLEEGEGVAIRIMMGMNLPIEDLYSEFSNSFLHKKAKHKSKLFVDEFGYDMNKKAEEGQDPVIGREKEILRMIEILCRRTKNNPLLLGDAGVGKSALVEELARRIVKNEVPPQLKEKRIVSVAMSSLVSGTKYRGEFEERITKLLKELEEDQDIILFIDEIHTLVGAGGAEGAIDASNILKPALARGKIRIIGATTTSEYKEFMEDDRALERRFQPIYVEEPKEEEVYEILLHLKPIYEKYHNVVIEEDILKWIVTLSNRYIYDRKQPDKAIDILDEVCSHLSIIKDRKIIRLEQLQQEVKDIKEQKNKAIMENDFASATQLREEENKRMNEINHYELSFGQRRKNRKVTKEMIAEVIHKKSKVPVYEILQDNYQYLKNLESYLKKEVLAQEEAIHSLVKFTKRLHFGYRKENVPASFLFVGPTGVGKTLLANLYTNFLYGKENFIRLDMSEYKEEHSISKIIGSPPGYVGYSDKTTVLEEIKMHPNAVLLLDEIEKAHPSVLQLFLQVLDYGKMKDARGEVCHFHHNVIIMTSNIGSNTEKIGFLEEPETMILEQLKEYLSVEFINRIDSVISFHSFTKSDMEILVKKKLKKLKEHYKTLKTIKFTPQVIDQIIELSNYPLFGARKIDKIISSKIDDLLIDEIIKGKKSVKIESIVG